MEVAGIELERVAEEFGPVTGGLQQKVIELVGDDAAEGIAEDAGAAFEGDGAQGAQDGVAFDFSNGED